ncbi:DUF3750 domain-containing protein [Rhodoplanes sp. TEM]|uniref:DUF3750 domain-containing protein n=1 Tax=Rhodoplanes tepidamans TaxID=200616 RepID=A0ABT5JHS5_RHOTP|nr:MULTISPECIES: DUF3750 domain-containing protein [Rhodoplanes]MDC7788958.1 DUF3750 domain-containing protein [Rhodoplanes tepidamans]MDC7987676.1 DUF3750 domain-containing protein [Rhodoplanes sp. TEM]MDQ0358652.1 hypothetical protein [Rhodoplanes tepidamans]
MILAVLAVFLLPLAVRAVLHAAGETPRSWRDADWSSIGSLPPAAAHPDARVLVLTGRTGGWKGVVAVHSWVVLKEKDARSWSRWDVVGWGNPVRMNGWAPDGRWYGNPPIVVADVSGEAAEALIPKIRAAIRGYQWANAGDYRVWPGPNSNTFVASVLRAVPELAALLPANAIGRDFRPGAYVGPSDSGTGVEASAWGVVGVKAGWVEGLELNLLGLVVGLDVRRPALKLPGYGRIGLDPLPSAAAAGR